MENQLTVPEAIENIKRLGQNDPAVTFLAQHFGNTTI